MWDTRVCIPELRGAQQRIQRINEKFLDARYRLKRLMNTRIVFLLLVLALLHPFAFAFDQRVIKHLMPSTIHVEILRQSTPDAAAVTEKFAIPYRRNMNITSLLGEIALNPINVEGAPSTPVTYDSNCLEEICGSCAMLINGRARMACSTLVDTLLKEHPDQPIRLAPLTKFPVVRDLSSTAAYSSRT